MTILNDAFQRPGDVTNKATTDTLLTDIAALAATLGGDQFREEGLDENSLQSVSSMPIRVDKTGPVTKAGAAAYGTLVIGTNVRSGAFTVANGQKMVIRAQVQCPNLPAGLGIPAGQVVSMRLAYSIGGVVTTLTAATERKNVGDNQANVFTMDTVLLPASYDWVEVQESRSGAGNYNFWMASLHGELFGRPT